MQYHRSDLRNRDNRRIQSIDDFIALLSQYGCRPRRAGSGWVALCPAHELDGQKHSPSLSVKAAQDGRILVHCFANCPPERVVAALGLRMSDLMPPPSRSATNNRSGQASAKQDSESAELHNGKAFASAEDAIAALARQLRCEPAHKWPYRNLRGETIAYAVRFDPPSGQGKVIRYVSLRETGWQIAGIPAPRPPYRLPEILAIRERNCLVIVEGEKTAEAAVKCGLVATTSAGGAEAASKTNWALLEPASWRRIVVLPDNDDAGERYADEVARQLWAAGARDIRIVRLVDYATELPPSGDLADVINATDYYGLLGEGATLTDVGRWILQIAEQTPAWQPETAAGYLQWEAYPTDALPSPFREFVRETAAAIGCDESFVALPLLAQAAAAIGTTRMLEIKPTWRVPAVLWAVVVGESGSLKTAALWAALEWAHERETALQLQFQKDWQKYEDELARWKEDGGLAGNKPKAPIAKRLLIQDITIEALAPVLKTNPRGVLLARDELAAWLRGFDKYSKNSKGAEAPNWLSLYNAKSITIDRKTSGTIHVPIAAVSIIGGIQPHVLKRALSNDNRENGLAARLLMTMPPRCCKRWTDAVVDPMTSRAVKQVLGKLFALEHEYSGVAQDRNSVGHYKPEIVRLSPDAKAEYIAFYNANAKRLEEATGDWASALSKLEELPARLALVIHLVRWANGEQVNPDEVDADSMQRAIKLTEWHIHETQRIYQFLDASGGEESQLELLDWLRRRGGSATVRELYTNGPRVFRHNQTAAEAALDELAKRGYGRWETVGGERGGRPKQVFRLLGIERAAPSKAESGEADDDALGGDAGDNGSGDGGDSGSGGSDGGGDNGSGPLPNPGLAAVAALAADAKPCADEIRADENTPQGADENTPWPQNPRNSIEIWGFASAARTTQPVTGSADENRADEIPADENRGADEIRADENRADENPADENRGSDENRADENQLGEDERQLLAWLRQHGGTATVREIRRGLRAMQRPGVAEAILKRFSQLGLGHWEPAPAGRRGRTARRFRLTQPTDAPSGQTAAEPASGEVEPATDIATTAPNQEPATQTEPVTATPTATTTEDAESAAEAEPALEPISELAPLEILDRAMRLPTEWRERFWQLLDAAGRCPLPDRALQAYRRLIAELPSNLKAILAAAPSAEPNRPDNAVIVAMMAKLSPELQRRFWQIYDRYAGKHPRKELPWLAWQELQREITQDTDPDTPQNGS
jgi:uncharacterized membrane protein YgcG